MEIGKSQKTNSKRNKNKGSNSQFQTQIEVRASKHINKNNKNIGYVIIIGLFHYFADSESFFLYKNSLRSIHSSLYHGQIEAALNVHNNLDDENMKSRIGNKCKQPILKCLFHCLFAHGVDSVLNCKRKPHCHVNLCEYITNQYTVRQVNHYVKTYDKSQQNMYKQYQTKINKQLNNNNNNNNHSTITKIINLQMSFLLCLLF
jgi:hypothetical protein